MANGKRGVPKGTKLVKREQEAIYIDRKMKMNRQFNMLLKTVKSNKRYLQKFDGVESVEKMAEELLKTAQAIRSENVKEQIDVFAEE